MNSPANKSILEFPVIALVGAVALGFMFLPFVG